MSEWFWLAPLFPLAAALLVVAALGARPGLAGGVAIGGVALAAASSLASLGAVAGGAGASLRLPWLTVGGHAFSLALRLDPLSAIMVVLVTLVALVVFTYAVRYMAGEPRYARFFALLSLFVAAQLTLVLADDVVLLFAAWELVGFCSYLLIGFWYERPGVPAAATKAFLVTRIADAGLLAGFLLLVRAAGTGSIPGILAVVEGVPAARPVLAASAVLLFIGAMGKSAQVPLHAWLPDAMAGPTPVSALIHSATMVVAGVYLVSRFFPLFEASGVLPAVAWIGALSAVFGAAAALGQSNLKRMLAYSTMSQIGLMFIGLGAGSLTAGMLLLVGQAFYKSLLFLGAGSIGHVVGSTDFEPMGGLARRMPVTFAVFALGALALAGLPVTLAWPVKDAVLAAAWDASPALFVAALLASLLTALYTARAVALAFFGVARSRAAEQATDPGGLLGPKIALAALLVTGAAAASPLGRHPFSRLLGAPVPEVHIATTLALIAAAAGLLVGWAAHHRWPGTVVWPPLSPFEPAAERGLGFPALYAALARRTLALATLARAFDRAVFEPFGTRLAAAVRTAVGGARTLDAALFEPIGRRVAALVLGLAQRARQVDLGVFEAASDVLTRGVLALAAWSRRFDVRQLDAGFAAGATSLVRLGQCLRATQTGRVYNYFLAIFVWGLGALLAAAAVIIF